MRKIVPEKIAQFQGHRDCIYALEKIDQTHFVTAGGDGMVVEWSLDEPDKGVLLAQVPNSVYALLPLSERKQIVVGHNTQGLHLICTASKKELTALYLGRSTIFDLKTDGKIIWAALQDGSIAAVDVENFSLKFSIKISEKSVRRLLYIPEKKWLLAGCSDGKIYKLSARAPSVLETADAHHPSVFTLIFLYDKNKMCTGGRDAHIKTWNIDSLACTSDIPAHLFAVNDIVYLNNKDLIVSVSMDKSVKVWDATTMQLLKVLDKSRWAGHGTSVNKALWMEKREILVTAGDDRVINLWKLEEHTS